MSDATKVTNVGGLEFEVRNVKMLVRKGGGVWLMVGIEGKDGRLRKYIMKEVKEWRGEQNSEVDWA